MVVLCNSLFLPCLAESTSGEANTWTHPIPRQKFALGLWRRFLPLFCEVGGRPSPQPERHQDRSHPAKSISRSFATGPSFMLCDGTIQTPWCIYFTIYFLKPTQIKDNLSESLLNYWNMKYHCWFYTNIYKSLSIFWEPLVIFYVFATRKGEISFKQL